MKPAAIFAAIKTLQENSSNEIKDPDHRAKFDLILANLIISIAGIRNGQYDGNDAGRITLPESKPTTAALVQKELKKAFDKSVNLHFELKLNFTVTTPLWRGGSNGAMTVESTVYEPVYADPEKMSRCWEKLHEGHGAYSTHLALFKLKNERLEDGEIREENSADFGL